MNYGAEAQRIVLDSNVLASALGFPKDSPPSQILNLAAQKQLMIFVSPFIAVEVERFLRRKTTMDLQAILNALEHLRRIAEWVHPRTKISVIRRKDSDNRILECAVAAKAQVLVSGDKRDILPLGIYQGIRIMSPRAYLDEFGLFDVPSAGMPARESAPIWDDGRRKPRRITKRKRR